jgi:chaperone BCS1
MISAMANSLDYNVHDFELTTAKDSNELEKVLIETTGKSTIVVEDIDFSLDLT